MKIKSMLGCCSYKGCHKKYDYDIISVAGGKVYKFRLCAKHEKKYMKCNCEAKWSDFLKNI